MKCPIHDTDLIGSRTRYGIRHACHVEGCTVVCWNGATSTPADQETRDLRHECHEAFDPLWRNKIRWKNRSSAYSWLREFMGTGPNENHIGMFTKVQCLRLLEALKVPCK